MRKILLPLVAGGIAVAIPCPAKAQSVGRMLERDFKNFGSDVWAVWTSPFHAHGRDWLIAAGTVGGGAVLSVFDDNIDRWMVENRNASGWSALKELREGGVAFSGRTVTPVSVGILAIGLVSQ